MRPSPSVVWGLRRAVPGEEPPGKPTKHPDASPSARGAFLSKPRPHLWCSIRHLPDSQRLEFTVRDPAREGSERVESRPASADELLALEQAIRELQSALNPPAWGHPHGLACQEILGRLGTQLSSLIPAQMRRRLAHLGARGGSLTLDVEGGIPWELARMGDPFLWQMCPTGRSGSTRARPRPGRRRGALIVADPEGLLPTAREEAEELEGLFGGWFAAEALIGTRATAHNVLEALETGSFSLLHLSTYEEQCPWDPPSSRLFLAGSELTAGRLAELEPRAPPGIVFLSLFHAGRARGSAPWPAFDFWARTFQELGCEAVIAPQWEVSAGSAREVARGFYRRLQAGSSLGAALQEVRRVRCVDPLPDPHLAPHAYLVYGETELELQELHLRPSPELATERSRLAPTYRLILVEGPEKGREIPLFPQLLESGAPISIGRPGVHTNDIEIRDPRPPNRAASLRFHRGSLVLENLSGQDAGVRVSGLPLREPTVLRPGDTFQIGSTVFELTQESAREATKPPTRVGGEGCLEIIRGLEPDREAQFRLGRAMTVIGRSPGCDIALHDPEVSRQHLTVVLRGGLYYAVDAGSSNPIFVNGILVEQERELTSGDVIQLSGTTHLRFRYLTAVSKET